MMDGSFIQPLFQHLVHHQRRFLRFLYYLFIFAIAFVEIISTLFPSFASLLMYFSFQS